MINLSTHYIVLYVSERQSLLCSCSCCSLENIHNQRLMKECRGLMTRTSNKQVRKTLLQLPVTPLVDFLKCFTHPLDEEGFAGICSRYFSYCRRDSPASKQRQKVQEKLDDSLIFLCIKHNFFKCLFAGYFCKWRLWRTGNKSMLLISPANHGSLRHLNDLSRSKQQTMISVIGHLRTAGRKCQPIDKLNLTAICSYQGNQWI